MGEKAYYFDETSGELQKDTWIGDYYADDRGSRVTERLCVIGGKTYYFDAEGFLPMVWFMWMRTATF